MTSSLNKYYATSKPDITHFVLLVIITDYTFPDCMLRDSTEFFDTKHFMWPAIRFQHKNYTVSN